MFGISPGDTLILLGDIKRGLAIPPKSTFDGLSALVFGGGMPGEDDNDGASEN